MMPRLWLIATAIIVICCLASMVIAVTKLT